MITTFRWTTTVDGPAPVPDATITLLDGRDGRVEGFAPWLAVSGLAAAPGQASARVVVTSSEGASLALDPDPGDRQLLLGRARCGSTARRTRASGPLPWGRHRSPTTSRSSWTAFEHRAQAVWPDGEVPDPDGTPSVPLRFTPPLPAPTS